MSAARDAEADRPTTAVVVCTHNGAKHVGELLESIARQTVSVDEIWVFDWGSTDGTNGVVADQLRRNGHPWTTFLRHEPRAPGAARSFLTAIEIVARLSAAELVLLADQDDLWMADKARRLQDEFRAAPFDLAYSDVEVVREDGRMIAPSFYGPGRGPYVRARPEPAEIVLLSNVAIGMTMCVRRAWLQRVAGALQGNWVMHDWALMILAWLSGATVRYVDQPLVKYRQHGANTLGAPARRSWFSKLKSARSHAHKVRLQLEAAITAGRTLELLPDRVALAASAVSRLRQARWCAGSRTLCARYRAALALSYLLL